MNIKLSYTPAQLDIFFPAKPQRHNIIPKGRRFGATQGGAHAFVEWAAEGMPMLWGDTIHGNIARYVDRYFMPALTSNGIRHQWREQKGVLKIMDGYIDFRSADNPMNWEGFGYRKIILNEAGIILKDPYLYTNAVRPMMLDHQDSELFALGVPKGKMLKDGTEHPFYTLWQRIGTPGYNGRAYSSYDNPMNSVEDVDALVQDILSTGGAEMVQQEVYGEFIDRVAGNPFAFAFDRLRHVGAVVRRPSDHHFFSLDFNVEPFTAIVSHIWDDAQGHHFHTFAEVALKEASIRGMAAWIREQCPHDHLMRITGDRGGNSRAIGANGSIRLFDELRKELRISDRQFTVPPNPPHLKSREDTNYVLSAHPDVRIAPACTGLIADLQTVEVDRDGGIVKSDRSKQAQRADKIDCFAGDTMVATSRGQVPIAAVRIGDVVTTSKGVRTVTDQWCSGAREVWEYTFEDGRTLQATPSHRINVINVGWIPIHDVYLGKHQACILRSHTMGSNIASTPSNPTTTEANARPVNRDACTGKSGWTRMGQYLQAWMSTTRTTTLRTTTCRTWSLSKDAPIIACTALSEPRRIQSISSASAALVSRLLQLGTEAWRVWSGIMPMRSGSAWVIGNPPVETAITAACFTSTSQHTHGSAAMDARPRQGTHPVSITSPETACTAVRPSRSTNTERPLTAAADVSSSHIGMRVVSAKLVGMLQVYDITVDGDAEFYANGVLVHNCYRYTINTYLRRWVDQNRRR